MTERPSQQRQIEELDRRIRELQDRLNDRFTMSIRPQVWLAKTVSEIASGEGETEEREYPSGNSSTFGIAFRHPKFTERIGDQKLEGPLGNDVPQRYALTVPKRYMAEDSDVMVVELDGQFYFLPSGREVLIVQLDKDLEAAKIATTGGGTGEKCITPSFRPATIWSYNEQNLLCETERKLDWPEGVFNFQTDKVHKRDKGNGDPNLILVYREADSGKFVPECSTCDAPGGAPGSLECDCLFDENLCQVFIHFRQVKWIDRDDEIPPGVPNNKWPEYCNFIVFPSDTYTLCLGGCVSWNRDIGFEVFPELGFPESCNFGVFQVESNWQHNYLAIEHFPCMSPGDRTGIIARLLCPNPTDGTGSATAELYVRECSLMIIHFDDVSYEHDYPRNGNFEGNARETKNRVTWIEITSLDQSNPANPGDRCHCLLETTRLDLNQGTFNASTGTPNLQHGPPNALNMQAHNYTVNVAGTHDFGDGGVALQVNDVVVYDDLLWKWIVIPNAGGVINQQAFAPVEIKRFIDSDGCDWTDTIFNAQIAIRFLLCQPP